MSLPQFKVLRPRTLEEALLLLARHAGESPASTRVVAGGTDLIPSMRQKLFEPEFVLDIRHVAGLKDIRQTDGGVEIGALASLTAIEQSGLLRRRYLVLTQAAATGRLALAAQHGHDWRKHLSRHSLPLVQPVAYLAQGVWLLYQEGRRPLPRCSRRNQMLGGLLRRHSAGAAVPRSRGRNRERIWNQAYPAGSVLHRRRRSVSQAATG